MGSRLSVNINDETHAYLQEKRDAGDTATEVIRRSVGVYKYVTEAIERGDRLVLVRPDGTEAELHLIV